MKVLSLLQPWASLVVLGHKKIETRSWNTKHRGSLLIHASAGKKKGCREINMDFQQQFFHLQLAKYENLPFGAIIGQVNLVDTFGFNEVPRIWIEEGRQFALRGRPIDINKQEYSFGDYSPGRYGWLLSNPVEFPVIIPAKGSLSLWEYEMPENIGYNLPGGGHASFDGMPDQKTVEAVEEMVKAAKQIKFPL